MDLQCLIITTERSTIAEQVVGPACLQQVHTILIQPQVNRMRVWYAEPSATSKAHHIQRHSSIWLMLNVGDHRPVAAKLDELHICFVLKFGEKEGSEAIKLRTDFGELFCDSRELRSFVFGHL